MKQVCKNKASKPVWSPLSTNDTINNIIVQSNINIIPGESECPYEIIESPSNQFDIDVSKIEGKLFKKSSKLLEYSTLKSLNKSNSKLIGTIVLAINTDWYYKLLNQLNKWESNEDLPKFDSQQKSRMLLLLSQLKTKNLNTENFNIEVSADGELILNRETPKSKVSILIDGNCESILLCKAGKGNREYFVHKLGNEKIPNEKTLLEKFISVE